MTNKITFPLQRGDFVVENAQFTLTFTNDTLTIMYSGAFQEENMRLEKPILTLPGHGFHGPLDLMRGELLDIIFADAENKLKRMRGM